MSASRRPDSDALLEDHTVEDFERLTAVNFRGVFLGCKHAVIQFKEQGAGGVILNTGSVAGLVGWGGTVYGATKGAVHQLTRAVAIEGAPFGIRANAICPAGMPFTNFMAAGGMDRSDARRGEAAASRWARCIPWADPSRPRTARKPPCTLCLTGRPTSPASCCPSTAGTSPDDRTRSCSTSSGSESSSTCGAATSPSSAGPTTTTRIPIWHALREQAPVHPGIVHELTGFDEPAMLPRPALPDLPHFSAFSYAACDERLPQRRGVRLVARGGRSAGEGAGSLNSMLSMGGTQHRRYRALVQPSFVPAKAQWWIRNWIDRQRSHLLIDGFAGRGRAELNVDFCAAIPVLTITGSFGVPVEQALDIREALREPAEIVEIIAAIVAARRESPQDDLISVLVQAEMTDEDGATHRLSDAEIYSFALLLLAAGSGTTWKQMGITLTALLAAPRGARKPSATTASCSGRRSRSRCGGRRPIPCSPAGSPRTSTSTASTFPRVPCCTSASVPPTATPPAGSDPTTTTSRGRSSPPSPSGAARTCASACTWPAPK